LANLSTLDGSNSRAAAFGAAPSSRRDVSVPNVNAAIPSSSDSVSAPVSVFVSSASSSHKNGTPLFMLVVLTALLIL
jgi:hypothetical protein